MDEEKEIRFIEMFCGVGGFRLGLERCNGLGQIQQEIEKDNGDTSGRKCNASRDSRIRPLDIRWKSGIKGEGKVAFPDDPDKPSRAITTAESGANRMTHGILLDRGEVRKTKISTSLDANYYKGIDNHAERTNVLYWKNSKEKWVNEKRMNVPALKQQLDLCRRPLISSEISVRRLTPKECERLQGFPDDWTELVSDTQRYKQMGNAVSVPVITAIGEAILKTIK